MNVLYLIVGTALLVLGAELLVRGASKLAISQGISPLVVGLTVVAFGTSAPELIVSLTASWGGDPGIALGNVVGSNVFNILVILGASAIITPLAITQQLLRIEIPLMIAVSWIVGALAINGTVGRVEGAALFVSLLVYTIWAIKKSKLETREIQLEYADAFGQAGQRLDADPATQKVASKSQTALQVLLVLCGLGLLVAGADWLVEGAIGIATALGVSSALIGLTIIAGGTSLPEVATSLVAAFRGERDIAVGNVVGSNLFNLMCVLGGTAMSTQGGVTVATPFLLLDIPVMILVACVCYPIAWTGRQISRWEGSLLLAGYVVYIAAMLVLKT